MKLFTHLVIGCMVLGGSLQAETLKQKKDKKKRKIEQKIQEYKESDYSKKAKELKKRLKAKLHLGANVYSQEEQEFLSEYIIGLSEAISEGSIEGLNEACDFLEVSHIGHLNEALALCFNDVKAIYTEDPYRCIPCGTYIGDDGMEYDDGIDESTIVHLPFYSLPIHQWEKKVIEKIITSLAEKSLTQLLLDRKEMEKKGDQINHVHPLRFLGCIFSDAYLKSCMQQCRNNSFKWSNFIDGYAQKMREQAASGNLMKHIDGFCEYLKVDPTGVIPIVEKGNYEALVVYLLQV